MPKYLCNEDCIHKLVCTRLSATGGVYNCEHYMNTILTKFTVKSLVDLIFSHNEIVAIWEKEDSHHDKLVWKGMGWEIPIQYEKAMVDRIFGCIPESIFDADTINIRLKSNEEDKGDSE